ncbi:MAG: hypothetical protein KDD03_11575 [Gelidibacter sp.]|nr:hypothetical protein [Gelidibacter sp.]
MTELNYLAGANNTIPHQNTIAELLYAFMSKTKSIKAYSKFKILPEIGLNQKIPDLIVYKTTNSQYTSIAIFEICISNALKRDIAKCTKLMNSNKTIKEAFIIDISNEKAIFYKLYRLKNGNASKPKKDSRFNTLKIDLSKII